MLNETIYVISKDREGGKWISEAEVLFLVSLGIGGVVNVLDLLQHWALIFRPNKCILDISKNFDFSHAYMQARVGIDIPRDS